MSPERWERVGEVFHGALGLSPEARSSFLHEACGDDRELAREVESLLQAHREATTFVDRPAVDLAGDRAPGYRRIGAYRIVELLGRGGMGVVYLAERDDATFDKRVALKVLSWELAGSGFDARFRVERQILARLEHPGIARLLDGGTTPDGLPFLVLEHVEGLPLDRFAAEERLGLDRRLRLFGAVCEAVHAAHQRLIVHRDLKPANVLVTAEGRPKLLDFGIAKLLSPAAGPPPGEPTAAGDRLLTPPYASPEQLRGEAVTTATDVYSLGVILFELLTGIHPYARLGEPPEELGRAILERDPPLPSSAAAQAAGAGRRASVEVAPSLQPPDRYLTRRLRGDLDRIVLTAMHKDPGRRYPSAFELGREIDRYRSGMPIEARADSLAYRATKLVRRHKLLVSVVAAAGSALLGLTIVLLAQRSEVLRQRDRAQAVSDSFVRLFEAADPEHARGGQINARELLDLAWRDLERPGLSEETRADLAQTMGDSYASLGLYPAAAELLSKALSIRRGLHPGPQAEIGESMASFGRVRLAQGDLAAAEQLLREAVEQRRRALGDRHPLTARSLADLAALLQRRGDLQGAERLFEESIEALREGTDAEVLAHVLHRYSTLERERGDYEAAEALQRRALARLRAARGEAPDPHVARFTVDLGTILRRAGDDAEAERLYRRALEEQWVLYPGGHPEIATTASHLASVARRQGRLDEADALLQEVVEWRLRFLGEDHPLLANTYVNRANLAADRDDAAAAEALYRQALSIQERSLPADHRDLVGTLSSLGTVLNHRGEHVEAEELHRRALAAYIEHYGERHMRVAVVRNNLAQSLKPQQRYGEARHELEEAVAILRASYGDDHPNLAVALNNLAETLQLEGRPERAASAFDEAYGIAARKLGEENPTTLRIAVNRMEQALSNRPTAAAREESRQLLARLVAALGPDHPTTRDLEALVDPEAASP